MKAYGTAEEKGDHGVLTEKQRRVLDLLIENKTSKEIARTLGISPYTVDQRISLARGKLGVSSRNELAARYRVMRRMPARSPSDLLGGADAEQSSAVHDGDVLDVPGVERDQTAALARSADATSDLIMPAADDADKNVCPTDAEIDHRIGPQVFEGTSGALWRLGAIVATALLLVMTILGLFAIFDQLNSMLA